MSILTDPESQLEHLKVDASGTAYNGGAIGLNVELPWKYNTGGTPVALVTGASLGQCGKKGSGHRGIHATSWTANSKTVHNVSLKICFKREIHGDMHTLMKGILEKVCDTHSPIRDSKWYETKFSALDNGTKVFDATKEMQKPELFETLDLKGDHWNSPAATFGNFLYGANEDDAKWYASVNFPAGKDGTLSSSDRLVLYDERGKMIGSRSDSHGNEVYTKGGILLSNSKGMADLVNSKFYSDNLWACTTNIRPYSVHIKYSDEDNVVYPIFKMRTFGDVRFQVTTREEDPNQLKMDQVVAAFNAQVYEGVTAPPRKKKRIASATKPVKKTVVAKEGKFEREVISDSDVEGDEE